MFSYISLLRVYSTCAIILYCRCGDLRSQWRQRHYVRAPAYDDRSSITRQWVLPTAAALGAATSVQWRFKAPAASTIVCACEFCARCWTTSSRLTVPCERRRLVLYRTMCPLVMMIMAMTSLSLLIPWYNNSVKHLLLVSPSQIKIMCFVNP